MIGPFRKPRDLLVPRCRPEEVRISCERSGRTAGAVRVDPAERDGHSARCDEEIVERQTGGGQRQVIEQRIVNLLKIVLVINTEEDSGRPEKSRSRIRRLQANFLSEIFLAIFDGSRRPVVRSAGR